MLEIRSRCTCLARLDILENSTRWKSSMAADKSLKRQYDAWPLVAFSTTSVSSTLVSFINSDLRPEFHRGLGHGAFE
jgi:hypothetical protein